MPRLAAPFAHRARLLVRYSGHPDPNLTYAHDLVHAMGLTEKGAPIADFKGPIPDFGAAADGDAVRICSRSTQPPPD